MDGAPSSQSDPRDAGMNVEMRPSAIASCRTIQIGVAVENDIVKLRIVVGQEFPGERAWIDLQRHGPSQIAARRYATSTLLDLRDEGKLGSQLSRQTTLGQTALLSQFAQPAPRRAAQLPQPTG